MPAGREQHKLRPLDVWHHAKDGSCWWLVVAAEVGLLTASVDNSPTCGLVTTAHPPFGGGGVI